MGFATCGSHAEINSLSFAIGFRFYRFATVIYTKVSLFTPLTIVRINSDQQYVNVSSSGGIAGLNHWSRVGGLGLAQFSIDDL